MTKRAPWGSATTGLKRLMRREIAARSETKTGTVLSVRKLLDMDAQGSATWVVDVDIGAGQVLRNVAVKAGSDGERFYAGLGMSVKLARNTAGRFDAIGPGDRVGAIATVKTYTLGVDAPTASANVGLTAERVAYEFYQGLTPGTPGTSYYNDGDPGHSYPLVRIVDGDGVPV